MRSWKYYNWLSYFSDPYSTVNCNVKPTVSLEPNFEKVFWLSIQFSGYLSILLKKKKKKAWTKNKESIETWISNLVLGYLKSKLPNYFIFNTIDKN